MKKVKRPIKPPLGVAPKYIREKDLEEKKREITNKYYVSREKELQECLLRAINSHRNISHSHFEEWNQAIIYLEDYDLFDEFYEEAEE